MVFPIAGDRAACDEFSRHGRSVLWDGQNSEGDTMVIVAGQIHVDPAQRERYLAGCVGVVEQARRAPGCLDFAITADLIDQGRINVFERWETQEAVAAFRGDGPDAEQSAAMLAASVAEYDVADVRSLT
jgi:quinol monooxygenase YgiN